MRVVFRKSRVCLCEPVLQPHQAHALTAEAAGDVFAGAECAGVILEALGKPAPQNGGDVLILRNDAEQRQSCRVDGVVDGGVQGLQEPPPHAVDNEVQLSCREAVQLHHGALRVAQARGIVRGDDHGAVGAAGGEREGFADAGGGVDEAEVDSLPEP